MIFIKLEGHDFVNDIKDVVRLFYNEEEINVVEVQPPADCRGIFLQRRRRRDTVKNEWGSMPPSFCLVSSLIDSCLTLYFKVDDYSKSIKTPINTEMAKGNEAEIKRIIRRSLKRQVYSVLKEHTGMVLPWGMLTGIRPSKIMMNLLDGVKDEQTALENFMETYDVLGKKAQMALQVALTESKILKASTDDMISLYIGIPFCPTRCLYCSFTSNPISKYRKSVEGYVSALEQEMEAVASIIKEKGFKLQSIYMGGGTPTSLDDRILAGLLRYIEKAFDLSHIEEFTLEAGRPDSVDMEKLQVIKDSRVDRISINPQTMNDATLKVIGRNHTADQIEEAFGLARQVGINNINMDVIVGLPGEDSKVFEETMKRIMELGPESLTVHTMAIKRASRLKEERGSYVLASPEDAVRMVDMGREYAESMGMHPYYMYRQKNILGNLENIGYCKPGCESIYKIQIMEERQTIIAVGAGGTTKVYYPSENRLERAFNVKTVEEYLRRWPEMVERKRELLK